MAIATFCSTDRTWQGALQGPTEERNACVHGIGAGQYLSRSSKADGAGAPVSGQRGCKALKQAPRGLAKQPAIALLFEVAPSWDCTGVWRGLVQRSLNWSFHRMTTPPAEFQRYPAKSLWQLPHPRRRFGKTSHFDCKSCFF